MNGENGDDGENWFGCDEFTTSETNKVLWLSKPILSCGNSLQLLSIGNENIVETHSRIVIKNMVALLGR